MRPAGAGSPAHRDNGRVLGHDEPLGSDNPWQRVARRLQSEWRERSGLRAGSHNGQLLGSRLTIEDGAPPRLAGYLTEAAKRQVQAAVQDADNTGALLSRPRLWVDLLSSQPLCFNAFGDMAENLEFGSKVFTSLMPEEVSAVTRVRFEYSPGRGDSRYTGARSAFDVFVEASGPHGRGFIGIEMKYHESMKVAPARDRDYARLAQLTGAFRHDALDRLLRPPHQQLLLDHLLALRLQQVDADDWDWGLFALVYPGGNTTCASVAASYTSGLADPNTTFRTITLEAVCRALAASSTESWVAELSTRYLGCRV
jgi:hypothetical protein